MNKIMLVCLAAMVAAFSGCSFGPDSPRGFSLPKGSEAMGEQVFIKYECQLCHQLNNYEGTDGVKVFDPPVKLGGRSARVKTYAELVTSIINPSHKLAPRAPYESDVSDLAGKSKMKVFNDVMTVTELINLVSFLQPKYELQPITYTHYGQYRVL
ncbi:MAG: sulfur-oxidizing protein SoxX [Paraglaciecola sp.]|jgi:sulfur-oxidizing protein SoxX